MRNRWASMQHTLKHFFSDLPAQREQAQIYYEMFAVAPLLLVAMVPGVLADGRASR